MTSGMSSALITSRRWEGRTSPNWVPSAASSSTDFGAGGTALRSKGAASRPVTNVDDPTASASTSTRTTRVMRRPRRRRRAVRLSGRAVGATAWSRCVLPVAMGRAYDPAAGPGAVAGLRDR